MDGEVKVDVSQSASVFMKFHECDVDLKWQFKLQKLSSKAFYEQVTKNIFGLTSHLMAFHENLVDCIKRKDSELEDLYENGASLSKSKLETEKFDSTFQFVCEDCDPFDILTNEKFYNLTKNTLRSTTEIKSVVKRNDVQTPRPVIAKPREKVLHSPGKNMLVNKRKIEQPPKSNVTRKKLQKL